MGIADEELVYSARDLHVVETPGDFSGNGVLDIDDLDLLTTAIATGNADMRFDIDQSGVIDLRDRLYWVKDLRQTRVGDANLDGEFTPVTWFRSSPLVSTKRTRMPAGLKATGTGTASSSTASDMITAFVDGGYEKGLKTNLAVVPEPSSVLLIVTGLMGLAISRHRLQS